MTTKFKLDQVLSNPDFTIVGKVIEIQTSLRMNTEKNEELTITYRIKCARETYSLDETRAVLMKEVTS